MNIFSGSKTVLLSILCMVLFSLFCLAMSPVYAQKGSKPTFTQYQTTETETPLPDAPGWLENRDTWIFISIMVLLTVSTVAGLGIRSRRLLVFNAIAAVMIPGFWFGGCPCPVGSIQNVALACASPDYILPWTIGALFFIPLLVTLFFGRTFCGSACPIGALQELIAFKPVKVPPVLEEVLGLTRYIILGLAVLFVCCGLSFIICRYDPVIALFRGGTGWGSVLVWSALILLTGIFVARPYCRFFCPYGALMSICGKLAFWRVSVTPGHCSQCRLCETSCPYNAIEAPSTDPTPRERKQGLRAFLIAILLFPLLVAFFAMIGRTLAFPIAQLHPIVKRAELVRAEETGLVDRLGAFDETLAHYRTGQENETLYRQAVLVVERARTATFWFGIWTGVVFGVKIITFLTRKKRTEYQTNPARCFSCGRCFWYCPNQQGTRLLLAEENNQQELQTSPSQQNADISQTSEH